MRSGGVSPLSTPRIEAIWMAAAGRCGFVVERTADVYATTDGRGRISIGTAEILDRDDAAAQLIFHELCHALVQGPARWSEPDWGLANTDDRDVASEHACLRVQVFLARPHALTEMMAPTTEYRGYHDAIAGDPLEPASDPAAALAAGAIRRIETRGFVAALTGALAATRAALDAGAPADAGTPADAGAGASAKLNENAPANPNAGAPAKLDESAPATPDDGAPAKLNENGPATPNVGAPAKLNESAPATLNAGAAATPDAGTSTHPVGFAFAAGSGQSCATCAWMYLGGRGPSVERCRQSAGPDGNGARTDRRHRACVRWEPAVDCQTCGACCREAYHSVTVSVRDPVVWKQPALIVRHGHRFEIRREGPRCAALEDRREERREDQLEGRHEDRREDQIGSRPEDRHEDPREDRLESQLESRREDQLEGRREPLEDRRAAPQPNRPLFACAIYDDRPRPCRDFEAGGRHCLVARRRVGLSP